MTEAPNQNWHIRVVEDAEKFVGKSVRGVLIDRSKGIKAIYSPDFQTLIKYIFKRGRGWAKDQAEQFAKEHFQQFKSFSHVSVDQIPDFIKVIAETHDGETSVFMPNSPSFVFDEDVQDEKSDEGESESLALDKAMEDILKGGQGSGNFGHFGRDGERGGSMTTTNVDTELSPSERAEYDRLKPSQKKDYLQHRNAGMEHDTAIILAEPSLAEATKGDIEESLIEAMEFVGVVTKGGGGSDNFGHEGRPGERGGSGAGGISQSAINTVMQNPDGFTVNVVSGEVPTDGWAFAENKSTEEKISGGITKEELSKKVHEYIKKNYAELSSDGKFLGGWTDKEGKLVLDVSTVLASDKKEEALSRANSAQQDAIFNLKTFEEVRTDYGNRGQKREARIAHGANKARDDRRRNKGRGGQDGRSYAGQDAEELVEVTMEKSLVDAMAFVETVVKGGSGSGNFGHSGRPGERGGSDAGGSSGGSSLPVNREQVRAALMERYRNNRELVTDAMVDAVTEAMNNERGGAAVTDNAALKSGVGELGKEAAASFKDGSDEDGILSQYAPAGTFGDFNMDGNTYVMAESESVAEQAAIDYVKEQLDSEPENFNQDWLEGHIDTEHLRSELESDVTNSNQIYFDDIKSESSDTFQNRQIEELVDGGHLDKSDVTDNKGELLAEDKLPQDTIDTAVSAAVEAKTKDDLKDPISYLQDIYDKDDAIKEAIKIGGIDSAAAAQDAVDTDGWQHFISNYDGKSQDTKSGAVYWQAGNNREDAGKARKGKLGGVARGVSRNFVKPGLKQGKPKPSKKTEKRVDESAVDAADANMEICKLDESKRMVYGVFLWPAEADHDGDVISAADIEKVAHGFMRDYRAIDEMHGKNAIAADIVESGIAWQDGMDYYGKILKKGAWFGGVKVYDDAVWEKVKNGTYKGFSVRISGVREPIE
jgi:hypothetical protein